jgi:3-methyladenine DNA glycosylase AlkD
LLGEWRHGGPFDQECFTRWAVPQLGDKQFFIRKAIGWVLRDVSRKDPQWVRGFVDTYGTQMAGLTRREATRGLPIATDTVNGHGLTENTFHSKE